MKFISICCVKNGHLGIAADNRIPAVVRVSEASTYPYEVGGVYIRWSL